MCVCVLSLFILWSIAPFSAIISHSPPLFIFSVLHSQSILSLCYVGFWSCFCSEICDSCFVLPATATAATTKTECVWKITIVQCRKLNPLVFIGYQHRINSPIHMWWMENGRGCLCVCGYALSLCESANGFLCGSGLGHLPGIQQQCLHKWFCIWNYQDSKGINVVVIVRG